MTIKEAILKSLEDLRSTATHKDVLAHMVSKKYYNFSRGKTPEATVSAQLGEFIRNEDTRVKRIKGERGVYLYYFAKYAQELNIEDFKIKEADTRIIEMNANSIYQERDLHLLLSTYLKNENIYSKTIFHEQSKNISDKNQKWIHPDVIGIKFLNLSSKVNQAFMRILNKSDTFKITSYEIKKEINTDYELKQAYFQAVSNSSWANYGYLVALEISSSLADEMERLNQSFGIGIIELNSNPYQSRVLFPSKIRELDFKTIDKLCKINTDYEMFIEHTEKILAVEERYYISVEKEFDDFCDDYFLNDSEIEKYCTSKNIPTNSIDAKIDL